MDERSQSPALPWIDGPADTDVDLFAPSDTPTFPADGRFAGSFSGFVAIPETLLNEIVERTEAEPAAFGSFAAMGPFGSFELRRCDSPTITALNAWTGVTVFYYAQERHFRPILDEMKLPIVPLKRDFLHAYERVITELGQI